MILLLAVILEVANIKPLTLILEVINKPSIVALPLLLKFEVLLIEIEFRFDVIILLSTVILEVANIEPLILILEVVNKPSIFALLWL